MGVDRGGGAVVTEAIAAGAVERFRSGIVRRLGLQFDASRTPELEHTLRRRLEAARMDVDSYLRQLESQPSKDELAALALDLTVPETYFFRNVDQYRALAEVVLPARLASRSGSRALRILSAGCASGEEPYTIAMTAFDVPGAVASLSIVGVDINAAALDRAKRGRFSPWSLRETPESDRQRWFRPEGREFVLDPALRSAVRFERQNLIDDDPRLWNAEPYDVVFCRNVIMYFSPEQARDVVARIARALYPGGYLFLGHAETLRGISNDFHLLHTHGTFYYQKRHAGAPRAAIDGPVAARAAAAVPLVAAAETADTWVEAIRLASERVQVLTTGTGRHPERAAEGSAAAPPRLDVEVVLELLRQERFADALALVDGAAASAPPDADAALLRAVLLAHGGDLASADHACRELLAADDLNAGAHYLLALCREGQDDRAGARHHDQVAVYLDPTFAMPRLHLGLLARRAGDRDTARAELEHALVLLRGEDSSRVLLFGGGFSREALIALCRTELVRCGGHG